MNMPSRIFAPGLRWNFVSAISFTACRYVNGADYECVPTATLMFEHAVRLIAEPGPGLGSARNRSSNQTRAERMEGARILELVMFWIFEKRTVADYVQSGGFGDADSGFAD